MRSAFSKRDASSLIFSHVALSDRVIGLVHVDAEVPDVDEVVHCDLARPRLGLDEERWWNQSLLIPYGASIANGLRMLVGEERVRHAGRVTVRA